MTCLILFPGTVRAEILVLQNNDLRRLEKEDENLQGFIFIFFFSSIFCLFLTESCQLESRDGKGELGAGCMGSNELGPSLEESRGMVSGSPD